MGPRTTLACGASAIIVSHESSSSFGTPAPEILLLKAKGCDPNLLTRVEIERSDSTHVIYVHWKYEPFCANHFDLLLFEETSVLFVGAGTLSASIDLRAMRTVAENCVNLFWGFKRAGEFVLELGELDCFLYDYKGVQLGRVAVDPPYEWQETAEGIRFESPVYGTQWLRFS